MLWNKENNKNVEGSGKFTYNQKTLKPIKKKKYIYINTEGKGHLQSKHKYNNEHRALSDRYFGQVY